MTNNRHAMPDFAHRSDGLVFRNVYGEIIRYKALDPVVVLARQQGVRRVSHHLEPIHELGQLKDLVYYHVGFEQFVRADTMEPIA